MAAIQLYKPGQGYWVRAMTAALIGVLTLTVAAWLASQSKLVHARLPVTEYLVSVRGVSGSPVMGGEAELLQQGVTTRTSLVRGTVIGYEPAQNLLRLRVSEVLDRRVPATSANRVVGAEGGFSASMNPGGVTGQRAVSQQVLMASVAIVVILGGALVAYYFTGVKRASCEFLIATDMEMRKVNWSTRKDVTASTWVVIGWAMFIAGTLFVFDFFLRGGFKLIGVIQ